MNDPIAALLADFDDAVDPRPAFAEALRARLVEELARPRRRPLGSRRARVALIAVALVLLLTGLATATYLLVQQHAAVRPQPGSLTVVASPGNGVSKLLEILPGGRTRVVWHCPRPVFCGELTSVDWAPDGRRVAFTLDEIGGVSAYVGLHIVDLASGRDIHLPALSNLKQLISSEKARLGCLFPTNVAWAPDGRRLAYNCTRHGRRLWASAGDLHDPQRRHTTRAAADGRPPRRCLAGLVARREAPCLHGLSRLERSPGDLHHRGRRIRSASARARRAGALLVARREDDRLRIVAWRGTARHAGRRRRDAGARADRARRTTGLVARRVDARSRDFAWHLPRRPLWRPSASGHEVERQDARVRLRAPGLVPGSCSSCDQAPCLQILPLTRSSPPCNRNACSASASVSGT